MTTFKTNLNYQNYRDTVAESFRARICNPTVYWNSRDGFYVGSGLVPNDDLSIGLAYYNLNNNSRKSMSGTRREYTPIARGIRRFFRNQNLEYSYTDIPVWGCQGNEYWDAAREEFVGGCGSYNLRDDGTCEKCGTNNEVWLVRGKLTLAECISEAEAEA